MTGTYGKTSAAATKRRSNRAKVEWVPVTQLAYGKAICAADLAGVDVAIWIDEAIKAHLALTERELEEEQFAEACREAADRLNPTPLRREFHPEKQMPFVRRPAGVADNHQAGRPSSRHHQEGRSAQGGSTARSGSGAAGAQRRGEHPPVDAPEHSGTTYRPQQPVR